MMTSRPPEPGPSRAPSPGRLSLARGAARAALLSLAAALCARPAAGRVAWSEDVPAALAAANTRSALVLVDFYAPWCYSCYYMDQHVLHQPDMNAIADRLELVKVDVDSPGGARLKADWRVRFLPTYVVLNSTGAEVGRILGEQSRGEFFAQLKAIVSANATLADLERQVAAALGGAALAASASATGRPKSMSSAALAPAREILRVHARRKTPAEGLRWFEPLEAGFRKALESDPQAAADLNRLRLYRAKESKDPESCLKAAQALLQIDLGCQLPYDASDANACVEPLAEARRKPLYAAEWVKLGGLLKRRVFGPAAERCADMRSPVELAHELEGRTGWPRGKTLEAAIALARSELGEDPRKDRSMADNLRAFLDLAGKDAELEAFYAKLTAAFPDEYVYYFRLARFLAKRGRHPEALAQLDLAAPKAYGANRLKVSGERARSLAALGRKAEALRLVEQALVENPASFPDDAAALGRLKSEIQTP